MSRSRPPVHTHTRGEGEMVSCSSLTSNSLHITEVGFDPSSQHSAIDFPLGDRCVEARPSQEASNMPNPAVKQGRKQPPSGTALSLNLLAPGGWKIQDGHSRKAEQD